MSTVTTPVPSSKAAEPLLTSGHWAWIVFQFLGLGGIGVASWIVNGTNLSLLWRDPMGCNLSIQAIGLVLANGATFLIGSAVANYALGQRHVLGRRLIAVALAASGFVILYLPAAFIVLTGPAAIAIQRSLAL